MIFCALCNILIRWRVWYTCWKRSHWLCELKKKPIQ